MIYFAFALTVYKKQILYVYQPVYESGGEMFPGALQKTLFGLVGAQLTLMGYLSTRGSFLQVTFLFPLPIATLWGMGYFNRLVSFCHRAKSFRNNVLAYLNTLHLFFSSSWIFSSSSFTTRHRKSPCRRQSLCTAIKNIEYGTCKRIRSSQRVARPK